MGKEAWFPGANDNASGVSVLLNLAKYYAAHPPKYSVAFIFFSGEEAGLIGSQYYSTHPLFPLSKIKFLTNLDLLGTGDDGIMVVNATVFKSQFEKLNTINTEKNYVRQIKQRGKAANSDHYWFTEKGVPSFFIYTMGGIQAYHDIYDVEKTLPLTKYLEVCELLIAFSASL
jgi:Zn-dependent M28 family amino/carboxypeptidase